MLADAVLIIHADEQWAVEEDLLGFSRGHAVLEFIFSVVTRVPLKADDYVKVNHGCILRIYTQKST